MSHSDCAILRSESAEIAVVQTETRRMGVRRAQGCGDGYGPNLACAL
jgi:hypothetical protein